MTRAVVPAWGRPQPELPVTTGVGGGRAAGAAGEQPAIPSCGAPAGLRVQPCSGRYWAPGLSWGHSCHHLHHFGAGGKCCLPPSSAGARGASTAVPPLPAPGSEGCEPWPGHFWTRQGHDLVLFQQHLHHALWSWTAATSAALITRRCWGWQSCCRSCAGTASRWPSVA